MGLRLWRARPSLPPSLFSASPSPLLSSTLIPRLPANVCPRSRPGFKLFMAYPDLSPPPQGPWSLTIDTFLPSSNHHNHHHPHHHDHCQYHRGFTKTRELSSGSTLTKSTPLPPSLGTWGSHKKELCQLDLAAGFLYPLTNPPLFPAHPLWDGGRICSKLPFQLTQHSEF